MADNWDLKVKARYPRKSQNNKSLHYFHSYVVKDRVAAQGLDNKRPQKSIGEIEMREFLPTPEVQEAIVADLVNIIPRVLVKYLTPYKIVAVQLSPKIESLYGLGRQATKL